MLKFMNAVPCLKLCSLLDNILVIRYFQFSWMLLTSHKHARTSENRIQKAIPKIIKWVDNIGFQISIEKTKSMLFSRKNYKLANRPKLNVWLKGERIEQVNKHRILGLIFDERRGTKAKAEKKMNILKYLIHTKWGTADRSEKNRTNATSPPTTVDRNSK
jgi:hypothetical protein